MTRGITKYSCLDGTHQKAKIPPSLPPDVEKPRTEPCSNALKEALGAAVEVPRWPRSPFYSLARTPRAERKTGFWPPLGLWPLGRP